MPKGPMTRGRYRLRVLRHAVSTRLREGERGSILIWFVITAPVIVLLAVLVVDGGAKISAGERAAAYSAEAARAATLAVGPYGGAGQTQAAVAAADTYLRSSGVSGTTRITGPFTVEVTVSVSVQGPISGHTWTVTRTASAQLLVGVENGHSP